jgi:exonuclease VII large subunit
MEDAGRNWIFQKQTKNIFYLLIFNIKSYKVLDEDEESKFRKKMATIEETLKGRNHYGFWESFAKLLGEKKQLKVGLIHGVSAQVWQDFISAYRSSAGKYANKIEFIRFESTLSDGELARTIEETANSGLHAVFLLRGGGSQEDLARVGRFESVMAITRANIPFYVAIGHSFDRMVSLIEKVADGHFATPSIAGGELGKLVFIISELENLKDEVRRAQMELKLKEQAQAYMRKPKEQHEERSILVWVILGILALLLILLFLLRK